MEEKRISVRIRQNSYPQFSAALKKYREEKRKNEDLRKAL